LIFDYYPNWRFLKMKYPVILLTLLVVTLSACSGITSAPAEAAPTINPVVTQVQAEPILSPAANSNSTSVSEAGNTTVDQTALSTVMSSVQQGALSEIEADAILYMREEEKLAHDVYVTLYDLWQLPVFQNIANSEQTHMEAVKTLIDRYGLPDPASTEVGVFTDQTLQGLYDQLVMQGSQSLVEALKVGAAIEEIDILDLEERIAQTDKGDIILVYENLMKGSRNHLRSFVSTLQRQSGETYQPQFLNPDAYQEIIGTSIESGGRGNPGRKGPGNSQS
jgi:hypothetical protein